jgi:hypothetical protein
MTVKGGGSSLQELILKSVFEISAVHTCSYGSPPQDFGASMNLCGPAEPIGLESAVLKARERMTRLNPQVFEGKWGVWRESDNWNSKELRLCRIYFQLTSRDGL